MKKTTAPTRALLTLLLASGGLFAQGTLQRVDTSELKALRSAQPQRHELALNNLRNELALPVEHGFRTLATYTDEFGLTHVRVQQTYMDVPVWGGFALAHVGSRGEELTSNVAMMPGVELNTNPTLSPTEAVAMAHMDWSEKADFLCEPITELVIWPHNPSSSLKIVRDPKTNKLVLNERYSTFRATPEETYALAYHVSMITRDKENGLAGTEYIVNAHNGEILAKWDGTQHVAEPKKGTGNSQYSGVLTNKLDTTTEDAGANYTLEDMVRPDTTKTNPFSGRHTNSTHWETYVDGDMKYYYPVYGGKDRSNTIVDASNTTNVWGNGQQYVWLSAKPGSVNGQTTAVDAHFAMSATWDYYKNLWAWNGLDNAKSPLAAVVHADDESGNSWSNASWNGSYKVMLYGDGDSTSRSLTSLSIGAHEMSHGFMSSTAKLAYSDESGGINEANSDIMAKMVEFYFYGTSAGAGATIPDAATYPVSSPLAGKPVDWTLGKELFTDNTPFLRSMSKPSDDGGWSYDFWFDGVGMDDVHYTSGIGNRMFYFLSHGAAANESKYYTSAFTGIGNDKAAKIWFRTVVTKLASATTNYLQLRDAVIAAATELYSATEVDAVKNAFAAINIGAAANGASHPLVTIARPVGNPAFLGPVYHAVPCGSSITFNAKATGTTNQNFNWMLGDPGGVTKPGGTFSAPGVFEAPYRSLGIYGITARSQADPMEFAGGFCVALNLDVNDDRINDATDLGALCRWHNMYFDNDITGNGAVLDNDIACFVMAFNNAYAK